MKFIYGLIILALVAVFFYLSNIDLMYLIDLTSLVSIILFSVLFSSISYGFKDTAKAFLAPFSKNIALENRKASENIPVILYCSAFLLFIIGLLVISFSNNWDNQLMIGTALLPLLYSLIFAEVVYRPYINIGKA
ncbi:hypothetical protein [Pleionea mediterranea]|uniref:Uncharacterized protein n=1 Tax=Pleionea mediterranea TaxID=523701 RepID=A0A316FXA8_9GAMM|nr:hypothetical protein [Pleionea mediterranea]PWK53013.1 hypothetical protein C8D97_104231 [Pleionea mediterranea]